MKWCGKEGAFIKGKKVLKCIFLQKIQYLTHSSHWGAMCKKIYKYPPTVIFQPIIAVGKIRKKKIAN